MTEQADIRERIVLATIECFEAFGIEKTTVRRIAQRAGVNTAAVNYYFGTKDRLVRLTLERMMDTAFAGQLRDIRAEAGALPPFALLRRYLLETLAGAVNYPGLSRSALYRTFQRHEDSELFESALNDFLLEMAGILRPAVRMDEAALRLALAQVLIVMLSASLLPEAFQPTLGRGLSDPAERERWIDHLITAHFPPILRTDSVG